MTLIVPLDLPIPSALGLGSHLMVRRPRVESARQLDFETSAGLRVCNPDRALANCHPGLRFSESPGLYHETMDQNHIVLVRDPLFTYSNLHSTSLSEAAGPWCGFPRDLDIGPWIRVRRSLKGIVILVLRVLVYGCI